VISALGRWLLWFAVSTGIVWAALRFAKNVKALPLDDLSVWQIAYIVSVLWCVLFLHWVVMGEDRS
jgi:hypothetical protein